MPCATSTWHWSTCIKPWVAAGRNNPAGFFGLSVCPDPCGSGLFISGTPFRGRCHENSFCHAPTKRPFPGKFLPPGRDSESGNRNSAGLPMPLCGSDQSLAFFFPHLGWMSRNISKFIPGMGRPSTETYSSSKRFLTAALTERSAQRAENSFSSVTSFIR